ncbi:MAG: ABC transporter permease [Planctomycetaceae bacterium]|nr:ABC transporter permease [Planctomycetaceae bacterium]
MSRNNGSGFRVGDYGLVIVLFAMLAFFTVYAPNFMQFSNFFNVSRQIAVLGIVSVGMTIVLICGGIDLSLGYHISLANVLCAWLMVKGGISPLYAAAIILVMGVCLGLLNGFIIVKTGVAPLIVTLAMLNILNGVSFTISKGVPIFGFPRSFSILGQGNLFRTVPYSLLIMLAVFLVGSIILKKTYFGRYFYAIGSNEEAAKLSGINTPRIKMLAYGICGFLASLGGLVMLSRTNSGLSTNGAGFEFNVITACVLGGVSANGGRGTVFGALVGVLIVGFLDNGLLLMNVSSYPQLIIKGVLMLCAVVYDTMSIRKSESIRRMAAIDADNIG